MHFEHAETSQSALFQALDGCQESGWRERPGVNVDILPLIREHRLGFGPAPLFRVGRSGAVDSEPVTQRVVVSRPEPVVQNSFARVDLAALRLLDVAQTGEFEIMVEAEAAVGDSEMVAAPGA